jgi:NADH-quinone oxidoreductase subunit J
MGIVAATSAAVSVMSASSSALTLRRRKHGKYIDPGEQVQVKRNDRLKIISMPAEKKGD